MIKRLAPAGLAFLLLACSNQNEPMVISGSVENVDYHISWLPTDPRHTTHRVRARVEGLIEHALIQTSSSHPQSELRRLNEWYGTDPFVVTRELETLLRHAQVLHEAGVRTLSSNRLNGFDLKLENHQVYKVGAIRLDLSQLGHGYALDRISTMMGQMNIDNFHVRIADEVAITSGSRWNQKVNLRPAIFSDWSLPVTDDLAVAYQQQTNGDVVVVIHESATLAAAMRRQFEQMQSEEIMRTAERTDTAVLVISGEATEQKRYTSKAFNLISS